MDEFIQKFVFDARRRLHIGLELEAFVQHGDMVTADGYRIVQNCTMVRQADIVLDHELHACQVEFRSVRPVVLRQLLRHIEDLEEVIRSVEQRFDRSLVCTGYLHPVPLDVCPTKRCQDIKASLTEEVLAAAGSVAGLHVHVGMPDLAAALFVYDRVRLALDGLTERYASVARMNAYKTVTPFWKPPQIDDPQGLYELAKLQGFTDDLKRWWALIRITRFGTIEFRIADATRKPQQILDYTLACHRLCRKALKSYYGRAQ